MKMLMVGAGDIGRRVIEKTRRRDNVVAATSTPSKRSSLRRLGAIPVLADLDRPGMLKRLPRDWDALIHAAPPQSYLTRDSRTRNLLRVLPVTRRRDARVVVYLSTSGVYGDCHGARISETQPARPRNDRAKRRVDAEKILTRAAKRGAFRLAILRVPGIYAADRLPIGRLRTGTPALRAADDVYTNHIHAADLATIALAAVRRMRRRVRPQVRVYHASDDSELKMGDYFDLVADAFGLPRPPRLPRARLTTEVSPMLLSFMSESRRLDNTRMKRELKVRLQFATPAAGVAAAAGAALRNRA
jgi:nucleoside-diphosphate-sugar epimerase